MRISRVVSGTARRSSRALVGLALGAGVAVAPAWAAPSSAAVVALGPIDSATGFPTWYEDQTGLRLKQCVTSVANCFAAATVPNAALPPSVATGNFPPEAFYYDADANVVTSGGGNGFLRVSLSGGFVGHTLCGLASCPEPGKQAVFARVRVRLDNLVPGEVYTITHPWGTLKLRAAVAGRRSIDYTADVGCPAAAGSATGCSPALALGGPAGPFLGWDPAVAPAAPAGYLGVWRTPHPITGSRLNDDAGSPQNYFRITGPNAGGPGVNTVATTLFQINGQVERPAPADTVAPTAPANAAAAATSPSTVRVSWDASTDALGVTGYRIFRDGDSTPIATTVDTAYTDTGLAPESAHTYTVTAIDAAANASGASSPAIVTTMSTADTTAPSPPAGLAAAAGDATRIAVSWGPSFDDFGVAGYRVYRDDSAAPLATVTSGTGYVDADVRPNSTHTYRVSAFDNSGNTSGQSAATSGSTTGVADGTPPDAPTGLGAFASGQNSTVLTWNAAVDNVGPATYRLFRDGALLATVGSTTLIFTDSGLAAGSTHAYSVVATDAAGNVSGRSEVVSVTTAPAPAAGDTVAPSVPAGLTTSADSPTRVTLTWSASTDNRGVTAYNVFRDGVAVGRVAGPRYVDNGLTPGTTYRYAVSAVDAAGNESGWSMVVPGTTVLSSDTAPPSRPADLTATPSGTSTINLAWTASVDNVAVIRYRVYRDGGATPVAVVSGTTYSDQQLQTGATYVYSVSAVDRVGNESDLSASVAATVLRQRCRPPTISVASDGLLSDSIISATATWSPLVNPRCAVTAYSITATPVGGGGRKTISVGPTATSAVFPGLFAGLQYSFQVKATDGLSTSVPSAASNLVSAQ